MQMSYLVNDWNLPAKNWFVRKATFARSMVCQRHRRFMLYAACSVQTNVKDVEDIKTSHNRFLTDFLEFILLLSKTSKMCVCELQCRFLIYFELQQSSN